MKNINALNEKKKEIKNKFITNESRIIKNSYKIKKEIEKYEN